MNKIIKWKLVVDVGDEDYIIEPLEVCNLFVPKVIMDGTKRKIFIGMVNAVMHNTPGVELIVVLSFINYINNRFTAYQPMILREMIRLVEYEFDRISTGGKIRGTRIKRVHTNPKYDPLTRVRIAAKVNGRLKTNKSTNCIRIVAEALQEEGIKPTAERIAAFLQGRLGISTVKTYLKTILSHLPDTTQVIKEKPSVQKIKFKNLLKEFMDIQKTENHHRLYEESAAYRRHYDEFLHTYNIMSSKDACYKIAA